MRSVPGAIAGGSMARFKDAKLIRSLDENGKAVNADSAASNEKQNEYLKTGKQFSDGARSAKPTIEDQP